jgi:PTH1 family peptidyl-tRNA hydrolase
MIKLIAGLGNPGEKYKSTRHNLGFMVLDEVLKKSRIISQFTAPGYVAVEAVFESRDKILLVWPQTFMNLSGLAMKEALEKHDLAAEQMLVVVDDFYLPLGVLRFRAEGGDGGHNGLVSIIEVIGNDNFPRLRLGTGPLPEGEDPAEFVLKSFTEKELTPIKKMVAKAAEGVIFSLQNRFELAMSKFNNVNPALSEND